VPIRADEGQLATKENAAELPVNAELRPKEASSRAHRDALTGDGIERVDEWE
jgi:hypothetical protein